MLANRREQWALARIAEGEPRSESKSEIPALQRLLTKCFGATLSDITRLMANAWWRQLSVGWIVLLMPNKWHIFSKTNNGSPCKPCRAYSLALQCDNTTPIPLLDQEAAVFNPERLPENRNHSEGKPF